MRSRISEFVASAVEVLGGVSKTPRLDVELIISHVSGFSRAIIIGFPERELSLDQSQECERLIERRRKGEPVSYLIGSKEFYGREFLVTSSVLVPRPESELLVEKAISFLKGEKGPQRILDLGTGSGCLAISIAKWGIEVSRDLSVVGVDSSSEALLVAENNAAKHGVKGSLSLVKSDWFDALPRDTTFDVIVANPPYIADSEIGLELSLSYEPHQALYAGIDGLTEIRRFFPEVSRFLAPNGLFLCEIGHDQGDSVAKLWRSLHGETYGTQRVLVDLAGRDRIFIAGSRFLKI